MHVYSLEDKTALKLIDFKYLVQNIRGEHALH